MSGLLGTAPPHDASRHPHRREHRPSTAEEAATSVQYNFNTRYDDPRFGIPDDHSSKSETDVTELDDYLNEIKDRKAHGLHPKPIDGADLLTEIVRISDPNSAHRTDCLDFFVFNVLPGTTSAAGLKAAVLKDVITGARTIDGISVESAFEQLSHMKGGLDCSPARPPAR